MSGWDFLIGNSSAVKLCSLMLILFLLLNIKGAFQSGARRGTGYLALFIVMTLYCVFYVPITGDNYTSMESYYAYLSGVDYEMLHFERIYFYIMDFVPFGYVYYRLVLWGAACLLFVWLMRKMGLSAQVVTLATLTFALPLLLYYQRAALAYVLLYVALYCYISKGGLFESIPLFKKHYRLISAIILICALPFHTTMPIYALFLFLSLIVPKDKLGISIIAIGLLVFSTSLVSNSIYMLHFFQEDTVETGLRSLENDSGIIGQNFNGAIGNFLHWLPLYCMLIYGIIKMVSTPNHLTQLEKVCLINTLILIAISLMFMPYSFTIQIKFRNAAMMPWTVFLASYYTRNSGSQVCTLYALATILTFFI